MLVAAGEAGLVDGRKRLGRWWAPPARSRGQAEDAPGFQSKTIQGDLDKKLERRRSRGVLAGRLTGTRVIPTCRLAA